MPFFLRFAQAIISNFFHARFLLLKSLNVGHRRSRIGKQWTEGFKKVKVWVHLLQFRVQQDQFGPQFVPYIFWVGSVEISFPNNIAKAQEERAESISIFQLSNAEMPKLQNCRSRETKEMCPPATIPSKM